MKIVADENIPVVKEAFGPYGDIDLRPAGRIDREAVKDADCLLVRSVTKANAELLRGSRVKFVATATIGIDHVDTSWLEENGIGFSSAPGSNAGSVSEWVTAALCVMANNSGRQLAGMKIGIIGCGNVGSKVMAMAKALGMQVMISDPPLEQSGNAKHLPYVRLEELLAAVDVVTLHVPLNREGEYRTLGLADAEFFNRLKPGAWFINSSRGKVMREEALRNAVAGGKVGAVSLDVWETEPDMSVDTLAITSVATPHIAGYSLDGKFNGCQMIFSAFCKHFKLPEKWPGEELRPSPPLPFLELAGQDNTAQELVSQAVLSAYPILEDDQRMRKVAALPAAERGAYFTKLRKTYPVRMAFNRTDLGLARVSPEIQNTLSGLGFRVIWAVS